MGRRTAGSALLKGGEAEGAWGRDGCACSVRCQGMRAEFVWQDRARQRTLFLPLWNRIILYCEAGIYDAWYSVVKNQRHET